MTNGDRELLVRIDERVGVIQREIKVYRREIEALKKKVYSLCGGLAVVQFGVPLMSKITGFFTGNHGSH